MSIFSSGTSSTSQSAAASGAALLVLEAIATDAPVTVFSLLEFTVAELPAADVVALNSAGISADGVGHLPLLAISVRQQNLEITRLLLRSGALASLRIAGLPLLLHYHDAAAAAAGRSPGTPALLGSTAHLAASVSDGGATSSIGAGGTGGASSSSGSDELDKRLQLLQLLLQHGADPLQTTLDGQSCFLSVCTQPAMLRLAVNFVRQQCERGRALSDAEAQQLVYAAARAFLSGF
ncbi:hypothetical protein ABPG75_011733 [Micractinium tetrahymenae]